MAWVEPASLKTSTRSPAATLNSFMSSGFISMNGYGIRSMTKSLCWSMNAFCQTRLVRPLLIRNRYFAFCSALPAACRPRHGVAMKKALPSLVENLPSV